MRAQVWVSWTKLGGEFEHGFGQSIGQIGVVHYDTMLVIRVLIRNSRFRCLPHFSLQIWILCELVSRNGFFYMVSVANYGSLIFFVSLGLGVFHAGSFFVCFLPFLLSLSSPTMISETSMEE